MISKDCSSCARTTIRLEGHVSCVYCEQEQEQASKHLPEAIRYPGTSMFCWTPVQVLFPWTRRIPAEEAQLILGVYVLAELLRCCF